MEIPKCERLIRNRLNLSISMGGLAFSKEEQENWMGERGEDEVGTGREDRGESAAVGLQILKIKQEKKA